MNRAPVNYLDLLLLLTGPEPSCHSLLEASCEWDRIASTFHKAYFATDVCAVTVYTSPSWLTPESS